VTRNDELKTFVFDRHCPANRSISSVRYNVPVPAYPPGVASAFVSVQNVVKIMKKNHNGFHKNRSIY
jgi:hypothetical protein